MDILLVAARIFIAAFLGALIGTEREKKNKAAGFRTHIIVSVGACLIMLIAIDGASELADADNWEPTRLVGQVVSGIGFLDWFLFLIQATPTFEEERSPRPSNLANRITLSGASLGDSWHETYLYCYSDSLCESRTNRVRASQWLEWSVWIKSEILRRLGMWE